MKPGPNAISGSGPLCGLDVPDGDLASGYQSWISSILGPRAEPAGPACAGSVSVSLPCPVLNLPSTPIPVVTAGEWLAPDGEIAGLLECPAVGCVGRSAAGADAEHAVASAVRTEAAALAPAANAARRRTALTRPGCQRG